MNKAAAAAEAKRDIVEDLGVVPLHPVEERVDEAEGALAVLQPHVVRQGHQAGKRRCCGRSALDNSFVEILIKYCDVLSQDSRGSAQKGWERSRCQR